MNSQQYMQMKRDLGFTKKSFTPIDPAMLTQGAQDAMQDPGMMGMPPGMPPQEMPQGMPPQGMPPGMPPGFSPEMMQGMPPEQPGMPQEQQIPQEVLDMLNGAGGGQGGGKDLGESDTVKDLRNKIEKLEIKMDAMNEKFNLFFGNKQASQNMYAIKDAIKRLVK